MADANGRCRRGEVGVRYLECKVWVWGVGVWMWLGGGFRRKVYKNSASECMERHSICMEVLYLARKLKGFWDEKG